MKHLVKPFLLTLAIGFALSSTTPAQAETGHQALDRIQAQAGALPALRPAAEFRALHATMKDTSWSEIIEGAINPANYQCARTPLTNWLGSQIPDAATNNGLYWMNYYGALDLPTYDALIFGEESKDNRFGLNGEYTQRINSTYKDLTRFWDNYPSGMQLVPMHGAKTFADFDRVVDLYEIVYGLNTALATQYANIAMQILAAYPSLRGGDHPYFTFNAFASSGIPALGISPRIVMGDGIMQGMTAIGLGDIGARAILGHEFGHSVQFAGGLFDNTDLTGPEATRRTELMADSFSLYFLTHARGEAFNAKRLLPSVRSFYEVGDCSFSSSGHHGTPNQRQAASEWASDLANAARPQGHILPSLDLAARFEAKLPELVAPDAP